MQRAELYSGRKTTGIFTDRSDDKFLVRH
jgi:hypothetical protein